MNDSWDTMRRAKEEQYFKEQNKLALKRLKERGNSTRLSPITGKPMEQFTFMGVVLDRCTESGGIWFDKGELEQVVEGIKKVENERTWAEGFFNGLFKRTGK